MADFLGKRTCLYEKHIALNAQMVSFGGFEMPIQYSNIIEEHNAVRNKCGMFDVSHMGEILISGPDAENFVQYLFTNDITDAPIGKIYYGMFLYEHGGTVDDLLVYKMKDDEFLLVVNAANIEKDYNWIMKNVGDFNVKVNNESDSYGQIAIQGPQSEKIVKEILDIECQELLFYTFKTHSTGNETIIISRTGYTGEDGFEIYGSHHYIQNAWDKLIESNHVTPCGLGCRDTLRFEVGLPLYGDELTDDISPLEAGLGMFVKADKMAHFIGKDAILKQKENGVCRKLVGIELSSRAIPRHGYEVIESDRVVGVVTTGYSSISTGKSVCMALVETGSSAIGNAVQVRIHKKLHEGTITKKRFYDKKYKK